MSENWKAIQERPLVQEALGDALEWLGETGNDTVKAMNFGGQGIIFRMESKQFPYPVSIKVPLYEENTAKSYYHEALLLDWELQALGAKENHEIFPELIYCRADGKFLIRQYLEGEVLHEVIKTATPAERLQLFLKATALTADIFAAFHENRAGSYILRDYRAKNVLVEAGSGRLYLFDCGSCRKENRKIEENYKKNQHDLGNGEYFSWSPERLMDWREMIDRRADFFSYGVLGYHILFGEFPYSNSQKEEGEAWKTFYREYVQAENRIRSEERLKTVAPELVEQLIGCLHPDPHKRFCGKLITP